MPPSIIDNVKYHFNHFSRLGQYLQNKNFHRSLLTEVLHINNYYKSYSN